MANKKVLRGMTWDHPRGLESLVACNDLVEQEFGFTIDWQARSLLQFGDQHVREFARDFDLMVIDHPHVPDAVADEALLAFDDFLSAKELDELELESAGPSHESYRYEGKIWGLALDAATQVSVYRPDLIDGPPPFWADVFSDARKGKVLWPHKPVDAFSTFATLSAQLGGPIGADEFLDEMVSKQAMEILLELASLVPEFCATSNPFEISERLIETDDYCYATPLYGYTNYSRAGFRSKILVYDDLPSFDGKASGSQLGGAGISVSSYTQRPEDSMAVARFLASAEVQNGPYSERHGQPGNLRAWLSPAMNLATNQFFRNTLRSIERSWVRPRMVGWPDFQFDLSQVIHKSLLRGSFAQSDWDDMLRIRDSLLERGSNR